MHLSKIFSRLNIDENYDFDIKKIETNTKNCDDHTLCRHQGDPGGHPRRKVSDGSLQ